MNKFAKWIFRFIETTSKGASLLILLMMAFVTFEVISRYIFNHPTSWVWLLNKQLFGIFVLVAGSYALIQKNHIRIEMLYDHFPPPAKRAVRWLTLILSVGFLGILVWNSTLMGLEALSTRETANGVFRLPLYPLKLLMPIMALLFMLGCLTEFGRKK